MSFAALGAALFLVPVVGVAASILAGDRPAPAEAAGIAALVAGIGLVSTPREPLRTGVGKRPIGDAAR